jgi:glycosidase
MRAWALALLLALAPAAWAADCVPDPLAGRTLYLRGSMTSWAALEDYAFEYRCDAWYLNVELEGLQEFKIADADWSPTSNFGAGKGEALVPGGGNATRRFSGAQTLRFALAGQEGELRIGARSFTARPGRQLTDPVALSLHFDSRSLADKLPFGAQPAGSELRFELGAQRGVTSLALVIERRLLEGNQERLAYTELARVPMTPRAAPEGERWQARYRFTEKAVYGYWFEARVGDERVVLQNNADSVPWTRERGSGGAGVVSLAPPDAKAIRRFRQTIYDPAFTVPAWAADLVYYQIFPDRFRNGDKLNDPRPGVDRYHGGSVELHRHWLDKPWRPGSGDGSDGQYNNDFFGGDLAGIIEKLDDIRELGANAIYLTPIFQAASNHKYDTADYRRVDPAFGRNEDFVKLTQEAAKRGIRVIPDTSLNHTGADSIYFDRYGNFRSNGAFEGGRPNPASPYFGWYRFDATQKDPDRQYPNWGGPDLPELDKGSADFRRFAYGAPDAVMNHWLDLGAAGWRMDVVPWVPDDFWREWRRAVKAHRPDAITIGEVWFDASKYFVGDMFDSTMNYVFRNAVLDYAGGGPAKTFVAQMEELREAYPPQALQAQMNLISSHDVARALYVLGADDEKADAATLARARQRLLLATFIQMTYPGAPSVYYGDEVGMSGGPDPYNRGPYPWADLGGRPDTALRADFRRLIALRHANPVLRRGELLAPVLVDEHVVAQWHRLGSQWALTATNNSPEARSVTLALPEGARAANFVDALAGSTLAASDGQVTLRVPAGFGSVLLSP